MASDPREADARRHRGRAGRALGRRRHLPLRPRRRRRDDAGVRHRHARRRPCRGSLHVGHVFCYTHTDTVARFQRMRGQGRLLPDRLGRQRPGHRAPGAELLRRPLRPALPYDADFEPAVPGDAPKDHRAIPISRPNFVELCERADGRRRGRPSRSCSAGSACRVDWSLLYTTIGDASRRTSQLAFLRNLARGEAYQREAPTLWDVDYRTAVAQAELEDRERPGAYHRSRSTAPTATGASIDTTRPELVVQLRGAGRPPRRRALPPLFGTHGAHAAVRRRGARRRPSPGRPGQGHRHRHGLHVRRHHRRHLVARARPADAHRRSAATAASPTDTPDWITDRRRPGRLRASWPARPSSRPRRRIVELLARDGRAARRAPADHAPGEVLRAGRPAAGDRHQPPVVHPQRRPRRRRCATRSSRAARSCAGTPTTCATATRTGSRGSTATG